MYYPKDFKHLKPSKSDVLAKETKKDWSTTKEILSVLDEFCRESSFHGLKYIRDPSLPFSHKVFWFVIFMSCFIPSILIIVHTFRNVYSNQVSMSFQPKSSPIRDIPFPAIMLCSTFPVRKSYFDLDLPGGNRNYRHYSKLICPNKDDLVDETFNMSLTDDFFDFLNEASIPCNRFLVSCKWNNLEEDCCDMFKPFLSPLGKCYVFNSYPEEAVYKGYRPPAGYKAMFDERTLLWDLENGYPDRTASDKVLPLWSEIPGQMTGLTVTMVENRTEWQQACVGGETGMSLVLFSPIEIPDPINRVKLPTKRHTHIRLNPTMIHAGLNMKNVPIGDRLCLYQGEIDLKYFDIYNQENCLNECVIDKCLENCRCASFFYQGVLGAWNKPFCGDGQLHCVRKVIANIFQIPDGPDDTTKCNCLPLCTSLSFEIESSFEKIQHSKHKMLDSKTVNHSHGIIVSQASVYFSKSEFVTYYRKNTASFDDSLSNSCGLLGLLLGFSFMSVYEVLYLIALRPVVKLFKKIFNLGSSRT